MLFNLKTELRKRNITVQQYADFLGVCKKTVSNKLSGSTKFTYPEMQKTCKKLIRGCAMEYLFADDGENPNRVS